MKTGSFLFYDLETSGFSPREQRIMQFAGQRTDMQLQPIGEPFNFLIKITEDILPDPDAVLLTGITPQMTIAEGITEAEFLKVFVDEISTPGTIFVGFNSIRFDDEFMRFLHYRNFYDAYEWHWADGRSRWDLLDAVRMTRALRPEGIEWPFDSKGAPACRLEMLASVNGLLHEAAHDALSDVQATIALAQLLKSKQPKLFDYLVEMRDKKRVSKLVLGGDPFVYTSGKYASEHDKTTVVTTMAEHPQGNGALVYDLRHDPTPFLKMKAEELSEIWKHYCKERPCKHQRLPVKALQYNRCPAVAPMGVLDEQSQVRLDLNLKVIQKHLKMLSSHKKFAEEVVSAIEIMNKKTQERLKLDHTDVDERLYDDFIDNTDKTRMSVVRATGPEEMSSVDVPFKDDRLAGLLPLYKARNFPKSLTAEERDLWQKFCEQRLLGGKSNSKAARYFERLGQLAEQKDLSKAKHYLLEELQLYGQSILPVEP